MNKQVTAAIALVLVAATAAWAFGLFQDDRYSDDPTVAELQKDSEKLFEKIKDLPDDERREVGREQREKFKDMNLSEGQRTQFVKFMMPMWMKMGEAKMDEFLALTPEEQTRKLDERIDQEVARQKERGKGGGEARRGGPWGNGQKPSAEKIEGWMKNMNEMTTPEQRAKFETVKQMYNDRREERGLEPRKGGPFGR